MSDARPSRIVPASLHARLRSGRDTPRRTLPVVDALGTLLPAGIPRGATVTTSGIAARSIAFTLTVAAGRSGAWTAVIGLAHPGWRAVAELGVTIERVVTVTPDGAGPTGRDADCIAAAIDGFDLVIVGTRTRAGGALQRRLAARARERGAVLIGVHDPLVTADPRSGGGPFDAVADLRVTTRAGHWRGLGPGVGRLMERRVDVVVEGRRLPGRRRTARLLLPGPDGTPVPMVEPTPALHGPRDRTPAESTERSA